ncbi:MAG: phytoene desaturase family protein [Mycobacteriales bacterium]
MVAERGETVDAIVIGAGHHGLVAANLLADAGWHVRVLEARDTVGGAVSSGLLAGRTIDLYSAFYPLGAASPVIRGLGLEGYGLSWRRAPLALAHPLPDGRCAVLSQDLDETAAALEEFAEGDGPAWRRVYAEWERIGPRVLEAIFQPFPPVRAGLRLAGALGAPGLLRFARFGVLPAGRYGVEEFGGVGARLIIGGLALHSDLSLDVPGGALYGWLLAMLGQQHGFPVPAGGAGRLTEAMAARLADRGGEVRCGTRVDRVLVRDGRALGVRTEGGEVIAARRAVLADVHAPVLYRDLVGLDALPARLADDLTRWQPDPAVVKVNWALSGPVPWTAAPARRAGTVHLGSDLVGEPYALLGQMTTTDPDRSPPGTETLWGYVHSTDAPGRVAQRLERTLEKYAPGFRDLVEERSVQQVPPGTVNGGTAGVYQQLVLRPVPGLGRPDTPIDRLYLSSASAHPGGGVHGACGANAARAALRRDGPAGGAYAATIRLAHRLVY